jgi:hypothetical protein
MSSWPSRATPRLAFALHKGDELVALARQALEADAAGRLVPAQVAHLRRFMEEDRGRQLDTEQLAALKAHLTASGQDGDYALVNLVSRARGVPSVASAASLAATERGDGEESEQRRQWREEMRARAAHREYAGMVTDVRARELAQVSSSTRYCQL